MKHYKFYITLFFCFFAWNMTKADLYYWVAFTNKDNTPYSFSQPDEFLSARAISRRSQQNIAIDSTDLPVNKTYIDSVLTYNCKYIHQSKWLNGITIQTADSTNIDKIRQCPFVKSVELTQDPAHLIYSAPKAKKYGQTLEEVEIDPGFAKEQNQQINLIELHETGFRGKDKLIAIFDTGFPNAMDYFSQLDIVNAYNISYPDLSPYDYSLDQHGLSCLSIMGLNIDGTFVGTAPEASFVLFVTEITETESLVELDHLVRGLEMADSMGVDVANISLGYSEMDDSTTSFIYADMNGKTARCSQAAQIASEKGMIVCAAAGNEGNDEWHYITAPADAENILTVGSVNQMGYHSHFSAYGPTSDNRIKPIVCAMGSSTVFFRNNQLYRGNGTSFSCPIIAGATASLWSALPDLTNTEIMQRIINSANQCNRPDNILGYGIPDYWKAYNGESSLENLRAEGIEIQYFNNEIIIKSDIPCKITLYNICGQVVMSRHSQKMATIDNLIRGIYIIEIKTDNNTLRQKILL